MMAAMSVTAGIATAASGENCWQGDYNYQRCCFCPSGLDACFDGGEFTFEKCCTFAYSPSLPVGDYQRVPFLPCDTLRGTPSLERIALRLSRLQVASDEGPLDFRIRQAGRGGAPVHSSAFTMARWIVDGGIVESGPVLDLGAGLGLTALTAAWKGFNVTGTDLDSEQISTALDNVATNAAQLVGSVSMQVLAWGDQPPGKFTSAVCAGCFGVLDTEPTLIPKLQKTLMEAGVTSLLIGGWATRRMVRTTLPSILSALGSVDVAMDAAAVEAAGYAPLGMQQTLYRLRLEVRESHGAAADVHSGEAPRKTTGDHEKAEAFPRYLLCRSLLVVIRSLSMQDLISRLLHMPAGKLFMKGRRWCSYHQDGPVEGYCERGIAIARTLADFISDTLRLSVPGDFGPHGNHSGAFKRALRACPHQMRDVSFLFLLGRDLGTFSPLDITTAEIFFLRWSQSFLSIDWIRNNAMVVNPSINAFSDLPRSLWLGEFASFSSRERDLAAATVSENPEDFKFISEAVRAIESDEIVETEWSAAVARQPCSLVTVLAAITLVDARRDSNMLSDAFDELQKAGYCLQHLLAKHSPWDLLKDIALRGLPLFRWHHRLTVPTYMQLSPSSSWYPHAEMQYHAADDRPGPVVGLLLDRDYESIATRADLEPFCSQTVRRLLHRVAEGAAKSLVDIGAYGGGCSVFALSAFPKWHVVSIEPFGPAYRVMSKAASSWWGNRWRVLRECVGDATLRLRALSKTMKPQLPHWDVSTPSVQMPLEADKQLIPLPAGYLWRHSSDYLPLKCRSIDAFDELRQLPPPLVIRVNAHYPALDILISASSFFEKNLVAAVIAEVYPGNVDEIDTFLAAHRCQTGPRQKRRKTDGSLSWTMLVFCDAHKHSFLNAM